jgi:putative ABC transport system permease protein
LGILSSLFFNKIEKLFKRSLNKNRIYALINILGLALGLTVTILIFMFVKDETSYDKHWDGSYQIYRVGVKANIRVKNMIYP